MPSYCMGEACAGEKKEKWANYGLPDTTKRKWCGTCAKKHGGVLLGTRKMCEDCHDKWAY